MPVTLDTIGQDFGTIIQMQSTMMKERGDALKGIIRKMG